QIVWNQRRSVRNPDTQKIEKEKVPESEWKIREAPHLRIIDQDLWDRVQALRLERARDRFGPSGKPRPRDAVSRKDHLLSGLLRGSVCKGNLKVVNVDRKGHSRVACAKARIARRCSHSKSYDIEILTEMTIENLKTLLADEDAMSKGLEEAGKHFNTVAKDNA